MECNKFLFQKLDVYKKTLDFVDDVYTVFEKLPYSAQKTIGDNLLRAAVSVASNIAEGNGRRSIKEKRQFFAIAQSSSFECIPTLEILHRRKKITKETFESLYGQCYEISRMTSGLIRRFSNTKTNIEQQTTNN